MAQIAIVYSTDYGATLPLPVNSGASPGSVGGFDAQPDGVVSYAAAANRIKKASSLGGTYADFVTFTANPICLYVPHYRLNDSGKQSSVSDPDLVTGLDALDTGHCLYKVTGAGVKTGITPASCTAAVGPFCIAVWWQSSLRMAFVGTKGGVSHLFLTTDGGTTWIDVGAYSGLKGVQMRAGPLSSKQVFAAGGSLLEFSKTFITISPRTAPVSSGILSIAVLG